MFTLTLNCSYPLYFPGPPLRLVPEVALALVLGEAVVVLKGLPRDAIVHAGIFDLHPVRVEIGDLLEHDRLRRVTFTFTFTFTFTLNCSHSH